MTPTCPAHPSAAPRVIRDASVLEFPDGAVLRGGEAVVRFACRVCGRALVAAETPGDAA